MRQAGLLLLLWMFVSCVSDNTNKMDIWEPFSNMEEIQLTNGPYGHFLHSTQFFSADDRWIVYDTRNDGSHIGRTCCIEMVNTRTKEIKEVFRTKNQSDYGPGVGGATFSPTTDTVLFIHGLLNCDSSNPYSFSRRTGVSVDIDYPGKAIFMDARDVVPPFIPGALRGGTHAHTWSGDGKWVSFTYNDALMAQLEKEGSENAKDLRMVGVMAPYGPVLVEPDRNGENVDGEKFSVLVTRVTEHPDPGTDQIDRAYEDGWVGTDGYLRSDGSRQKRAIAFLGDTRDKKGNTLTEVFVVDIPDDVTLGIPGQPLAGTEITRPNPPRGAVQRRITHTEDRKYPGVRGPRHWMRSMPDGSLVFFLMMDETGIIQVYGISPNGGPIRQITDNDFPVETTFNVSPDGQFIAFGSGNDVYLTRIESGETRQVGPEPGQEMSDLKSVHWSNDGKMLACNRMIAAGDSSYYQVFLLK